jgi:hypothetical protein
MLATIPDLSPTLRTATPEELADLEKTVCLAPS